GGVVLDLLLRSGVGQDRGGVVAAVECGRGQERGHRERFSTIERRQARFPEALIPKGSRGFWCGGLVLAGSADGGRVGCLRCGGFEAQALTAFAPQPPCRPRWLRSGVQQSGVRRSPVSVSLRT